MADDLTRGVVDTFPRQGCAGLGAEPVGCRPVAANFPDHDGRGATRALAEHERSGLALSARR